MCMKRSHQLGFTLIELMIVVAIIGILAAIAIPQFSIYRTRSFNAMAISDLRNLMTAEEANYTGTEKYSVPSKSNATGAPGPVAGIEGTYISRGVGYSIVSIVSGAGYAIYTGHDKGNTTFAGNDNGLMRRNLLPAGSNPRTSAANENNPLVSGWGTAPL